VSLSHLKLEDVDVLEVQFKTVLNSYTNRVIKNCNTARGLCKCAYWRYIITHYLQKICPNNVCENGVMCAQEISKAYQGQRAFKTTEIRSSSCNNTHTKQTKLQYCYDWWILSILFMAGFETGQESVIYCKYKVRDQSP
jgi:hypothetical protein